MRNAYIEEFNTEGKKTLCRFIKNQSGRIIIKYVPNNMEKRVWT
jgi:hypothetical protein